MSVSRESHSGLRFIVSASVLAVAAFGAAQSAMAVTYTPAQMRTAYGLNGVTFGGTAATGAGQTIAIIDWYNDANILTESAKFNSAYGLQTFNTGGPTLTVRSQTGTTTLPTTNTTSAETALDVQWAHAIAPQANILLIEPNSASFSDTDAGVNYAKSVAGVSTLSMSYGAQSFSGESSYESTFTQAAGHAGVSFFASTGDTSTPSYPATSTHVVAVGGTNLSVKADGSRNTETVWNNSSSSAEGTGFAAQITRPAFQNGVSANAKRGIPDLVMDADPNSGVYVYFGAGVNSTLYANVGGTSLSSPMMAALMAVANQGRVINGLTPLTSDDLLTKLYALVGTPLYSSCFYDVTSGSSNGYSAGVGFDTPSGLGSPNAGGLLQYLAGYTSIPEPSSAGLLLVGATSLLARRRR